MKKTQEGESGNPDGYLRISTKFLEASYVGFCVTLLTSHLVVEG